MEYRELLFSSVQSLKTNVVRTGLTMLGIIIGTGAVILIASIGQSSIAYITDQLSQFGTNNFRVVAGNNALATVSGGSGKPLTVKDAENIANSGFTNIENVAPLGFASRSVSANGENQTIQIFGLTPDAQTLLKPDFLYGENISDGDKNSRVVVLGKDVVEDFFGKDTDPVGEDMKIGDAKFRIIGVSQSNGSLTSSFFNTSAIIPLQVLSDQIRGDKEVFEIIVSVKNTELLNETMSDVTALLRDKRDLKDTEEDDFHLDSVKESLGVIQTVTGLLTALIAGISAISLVVGGVGVMNIMLVTVVERTREIGLLKSIGAKNNDIMMQFMIESVVITLLGGIIGIVIGVLTAIVISLAAKLPVVISVPWILIAVVVSSLVGIVFGLYPARRAAKLSPIDALRQE